MQTGPLPADTQDPPTFAGGPCPSCPGKGALLILRREPDARLLFHCRNCGLSFTHVDAHEEPEYGRKLQTIAPGGARPASEGEIRAAGLWPHATPWREARTPPRSAQSHPAKVHRVPPPAPATGGAAKVVGGGLTAAAVIKILMLLSHLFRHH